MDTTRITPKQQEQLNRATLSLMQALEGGPITEGAEPSALASAGLLETFVQLKEGGAQTPEAVDHAIAAIDRFADRIAQGENPVSTASSPVLVNQAFSDFLRERGRLTSTGSVTAPPPARRPIDPDRIEVTQRGAVLFKGTKGNVAFRLPASAVKDLFAFGGARLGIVPDEPILDLASGRHITEGEGPLYHYFFVVAGMKDSTHFAARADVAPYFDAVLHDSYEGSYQEITEEQVAGSYPKGAATPGFPNLHEELKHWKGFPLEQMRTIHTFDDAGVLDFDDLRIIDRGNGIYSLFEAGTAVGDVDLADYPLPALPTPEVDRSAEGFEQIRHRALIDGEPMIVPISSGSLFTPQETSGHMIFNDGRATIVDPPVNFLEWMEMNRIPLDVVEEVIITHAHVDHFGGLPRLLAHLPRRPVLATDPIVEEQMVRMLSNMQLGRLRPDQIRSLWRSADVRMLEPWKSRTGLWFTFNHSFHSVPAIGYTLMSGDPKHAASRILASYSGDTQIDPAIVSKLRDTVDKETGRPVIASDARMATITMQPWQGMLAGGLSIIDNGALPLHPGLAKVAELSANMAAVAPANGVVIGYHEAPQKVRDAGIRYLGEGLGDAIALADRMGWQPDASPYRTREIVRRAIARDPVLGRHLTDPALMDDLISAGKLIFRRQGERIIEKGAAGDAMYLIVDGTAAIHNGADDAHSPLAVRHAGVVGETALATNAPRTANVTAMTDLYAVRWEANAIAPILTRTGLAATYVDLAQVRRLAAGATERSPVLKGLSASTRDLLHISGRVEALRDGQTLIHEGMRESDIFFLLDGEVAVSAAEGPLAQTPVILGAGDVVGEKALVADEPRSATVRARGDVRVLRLEAAEAKRLMQERSDLGVALVALTAQRTANGHAAHSAERAAAAALVTDEVEERTTYEMLLGEEIDPVDPGMIPPCLQDDLSANIFNGYGAFAYAPMAMLR